MLLRKLYTCKNASIYQDAPGVSRIVQFPFHTEISSRHIASSSQYVLHSFPSPPCPDIAPLQIQLQQLCILHVTCRYTPKLPGATGSTLRCSPSKHRPEKSRHASQKPDWWVGSLWILPRISTLQFLAELYVIQLGRPGRPGRRK